MTTVPKIVTTTATTSSGTSLGAAVAQIILSDRRPNTPHPKEPLTRAEKGQVEPPQLLQASTPQEHMQNAFIEYESVLKANMTVYTDTCKDILEAYRGKTVLMNRLLKQRIKEADATIYDSDKATVLAGSAICRNMVAYNATNGFVTMDQFELRETGTIRFDTPEYDPIVVTTRDTKTMLDDRILNRARSMSSESWDAPRITWVNGVPGCGKTTWIINHFNPGHDIIITTTTEAAKDVRERLSKTLETNTKTSVRTLASVLVNGIGGTDTDENLCKRLIVDEALMNHFGAIVMAARIAKANELILIGDVNQLPYIDRQNLFQMKYHRPHLVANITKELLCTHRNPMDVPFAINQVYNGIYSSKTQLRSLTLKQFRNATIPENLPNTLYLVHTQAAKASLVEKGYGKGRGSRVLTIHEAQGLTYPSVVIVRATTEQLQLYDSISHAVVAVTRHTVKCVYYSDVCGDAIANFMRRTERATDSEIRDYNTKMAIKDRNTSVIEKAQE